MLLFDDSDDDQEDQNDDLDQDDDGPDQDDDDDNGDDNCDQNEGDDQNCVNDRDKDASGTILHDRDENNAWPSSQPFLVKLAMWPPISLFV